ncbi:MAG: hypothetical protein ACRDGJ_12650 [Candidatus Limnocylindria bacterium]
MSARWLVSTLADFLGTKRLFLILDNCEHILDAMCRARRLPEGHANR